MSHFRCWINKVHKFHENERCQELDIVHKVSSGTKGFSWCWITSIFNWAIANGKDEGARTISWEQDCTHPWGSACRNCSVGGSFHVCMLDSNRLEKGKYWAMHIQNYCDRDQNRKSQNFVWWTSIQIPSFPSILISNFVFSLRSAPGIRNMRWLAPCSFAGYKYNLFPHLTSSAQRTRWLLTIGWCLLCGRSGNHIGLRPRCEAHRLRSRPQVQANSWQQTNSLIAEKGLNIFRMHLHFLTV
jgi:hypothetical protein